MTEQHPTSLASRYNTPWYRTHLTKAERRGKTQAEIDAARKAKWEATQEKPRE